MGMKKSDKSVTLMDVAKRAGVGVGTASRVLNKDPRVKESTKQAVHQAMADLNYKPNSVARGLKTGMSKTFGVIVSDITSSFFSKIIKRIEATSAENQYSFMMANTDMNPDKVTDAIRLMGEKMVEGIFMLGEIVTVDIIEQLERMDIPVVLVSMNIPMIGKGLPKNFASVSINNERAAFCAVDYMCSIGCRKIAMLMTDMDDQNVGKARYDGYRKALKAHGIQHEDCLVISGDLSMESGYDCMKRLLDDGIVPDAVFAASDYAAFGAMRLLHERKIRIPEDISVIGFDGVEQGKYSYPSLTTINQPRYQMGKVGMQLMMDMIQKKEILNREVLLQYEFNERESCLKKAEDTGNQG